MKGPFANTLRVDDDPDCQLTCDHTGRTNDRRVNLQLDPRVHVEQRQLNAPHVVATLVHTHYEIYPIVHSFGDHHIYEAVDRTRHLVGSLGIHQIVDTPCLDSATQRQKNRVMAHGLSKYVAFLDNIVAMSQCCTIPVSVRVSLFEATGLYKGWRKISSKGDSESNLRAGQLIVYCFFGMIAGVVGGLLGLGGGFIMGPLFLELGVPPQSFMLKEISFLVLTDSDFKALIVLIVADMSSQDLNLTLEEVTKTYRKRKRTTNTEQTQTERSSDCAREERSKRNQDCAREERSKRNQDRGQSDQGNAPTVVKKEKGKGKIQPTKQPGLLNSRMGKVLDRVRKPVVDVENNETIQGKEKESDGVEVQVLVGDKAAMSDVEKISTEMKILAAAIVKFGKAMAEVGSKNMGKDIIKKTFSKMSDMLTVASTSQPAETSTLLDDDPIFNDEGFLAAVSAMEKAFIVTTNPAEHPKEVELDGLPSSPRWNLLTPTPPDVQKPNETTTTRPTEHNAPTNLQDTEKSTPTVKPLFDIVIEESESDFEHVQHGERENRKLKNLPLKLRFPFWTTNKEKLSFVSAKRKLLSDFIFMDPSPEHPAE
nr:sulfite exporter TauE/SafE family protein 3-like [Ipomoea batatas]